MTYHQFVNEVETKVQGCVANNVTVRTHVSIKNNSCERRGIMMAEDGINISPTIYLEDYYDDFLKGETMDRITKRILACYEEVRFHKSWEPGFIQSYDQVKSFIVYKVINKKRNEELLRKVPHREILDLACVYYVLFQLDNGHTATMLIRNEHLELWNVSKREVFEQAEMNVKKLLPPTLNRMRDILAQMLDVGFENENENEDDFMYVMSNDEKSFGAVSIFYQGVMEMVYAVFHENYFIIPSSVHEVILMPESKAPRKEEIEEMVAEINATQVAEEEILSNHVYYYDGFKHRVSM